MHDPDNEEKIHTAREVAERALVLQGLCFVAHQEISRLTAITWLKAEGVWSAVAPSERRFFEKLDLTQQDIVDATWRAEALWTLLWALGKIDELSAPCGTADVQHMVELMPRPSAAAGPFLQSAQLRSGSEIYEACDDILDIHWAVRDACLNNRDIPNGYHPGVVRERHFALNWLTYYDDEWDEITTDT